MGAEREKYNYKLKPFVKSPLGTLARGEQIENEGVRYDYKQKAARQPDNRLPNARW